MKRLAILLAVLPVSGAPAAAAQAETPTAQDIAEAHTEYVNEPCRQLIDQCDDGFETPAAAISDLDCRLRSESEARCLFRVHGESCRARLFRGHRADPRAWTARDFSRVPWRIRMRCR